MLEENKTEKRVERHKIGQEDFTPDSIVELMYKDFPDELYTDFSKTILDPCAGIGNLLLYCILKRLEHCKKESDVYKAISTVYGTELFEDNVQEMRQRILFKLLDVTSERGWDLKEKKILDILKKNIVCTDTFQWDYEKWEPKVKETNESIELF